MEVLGSDAVRAFGVFADRLNFTTAARFLHISQPALHVKIRKLSKALNETLYERNGRHLVLTPAGEALAEFAQDEKARVEHFMNALKGFENRPLVLASGRGAFLNIVDLGVAAELKRGTKLKFVLDDAIKTMAMVEQGKADVAVGVFERVPSRLCITPIASYPQIVVVPRTHSWAKHQSIQIRDLEGLSLAVPPISWPQRQTLERVLRDAGVDWEVAVEAEGWDLLLHLTKLGVAPAIANACVHIPVGFIGVPIKGLPTVEYSALMRRGASSVVSSFIHRLKENVR
ncbi:MAG: LysR family transcriptional regulator [Acidimicrobiales bacterium]|nr:MAG: LysR family transcriptional regulator [Acidimicrobiales bacterium]